MRSLFYHRGPRTDVRYMTRPELFRSSKIFGLAGIVSVGVLFVFASLFPDKAGEFPHIIVAVGSFAFVLFSLGGILGSAYLFIRGVFRSKDYDPIPIFQQDEKAMEAEQNATLGTRRMAKKQQEEVGLLVGRFKGILASHPLAAHAWEKAPVGLRYQLRFPKSDSGFDVVCEIAPGYVELRARDIDIACFTDLGRDDLAAEILGITRDLLSPHMRLVEKLSNGKPYKFVVEAWTGTAWVVTYVWSLLFWNYFGSKSQNVFQNTTLPGREIGIKDQPPHA